METLSLRIWEAIVAVGRSKERSDMLQLPQAAYALAKAEAALIKALDTVIRLQSQSNNVLRFRRDLGRRPTRNLSPNGSASAEITTRKLLPL